MLTVRGAGLGTELASTLPPEDDGSGESLKQGLSWGDQTQGVCPVPLPSAVSPALRRSGLYFSDQVLGGRDEG